MGKLYVISAPSGCGKTSIYNKLKEQYPQIEKTVSDTTRRPRDGETDGVDYNFISSKLFEEKINTNKYVEYTLYDQDYYGTLHNEIREKLSKYEKVFLIIEVTGAMNVKRHYPDTALIFITPPSLEELRNRIEQRGDNTPEEIERRLKVAAKELLEKDNFDYVVINDDIEKATNDIAKIVQLNSGEE